MHLDLTGFSLDEIVSIRTRPTGRVMLLDRGYSILVCQFQSAPGQPAG